MKHLWSVGLLLGIVFVSACRKQVTHSPIPEIAFQSFSLKDSTDPLGNKGLLGSLTFSFIDGDGDLGFNPEDTLTTGDSLGFNLFLTLYHTENGQLVQADEEEVKTPLKYRIPFLEKSRSDDVLSGEIQVDFFYLLFPFDTIAYDFYIVDRAGNQSNTESTPLIVLDVPSNQ